MRFLTLILTISLVSTVARTPPSVRSYPSAQTSGSLPTIKFENITAKAGLRFTTQNSPTAKKNQIETMVAGVALLDYDGDGWLDIYLVNGAAIPSLQKESPAYWNRLYRNNHDGTFTDVTERAGVAGAGYGMGVAVGDYDNDGRPDIFLANVTGNQLFHNNGDGTFSDVTAKAGLAGAEMNGKKMWSVGAGWFDYNNDGKLDLFVVNYCVWEVNKDPFCHVKGGVRGYCHPKVYPSLHNTLYRNNGDGTFTDVSEETGISSHMGKGMSVSFADYDGDGFLDAFVANDTTPGLLFHNLGGKKFEEVGAQAGVAYAPDGVALSGMGSDFRDINNDGRPDIWYTAVEHETFPLLMNQGNGEFDDFTQASGLRATNEMSGWGNGIFDFDNDGWKDLFVARANVLDNISELGNRKYPEPNSLFRNLGNGKFADVSSSAGPDFAEEAAHRGVAFGDLFNDGRIDAVVTVLGGQVEILRNVSEPGNHWILFRLEGTKSNRMGIGAQIHIRTEDGASQWNEVTTAVGYTASSDSRVHFGLGKNRLIKDVEIRWPSGIKQVLHDVAADRILTIEESQR
ncbi:MAG TPA: CRTAC1 family protein [Candidatus Sulfotelmatobacter sp.]|nr:CRTAC1 family protein [Candidatus Sulfotelmatobacter sp.]